MPELDNEGFDSNKPMGVFLRLVQIQTGIMCVAYSGADLRRWVEVDEDSESIEVSESTEDPLAEIFVESLDELNQSETVGNHEVDITPSASVAVLAGKSKEARDLKARVWLCYDLRNRAEVIGCLTSCKWHRDSVFLNTRFSPSYLSQHTDLPNDLNSYWFIDVVSSVKKPAGAILLLQAYAYAARTRKRGLCMIAVSISGRNLAQSMGFKSHAYREDGAQRWLCWAAMGSLKLRQVTSRLNLGTATDKVLGDIFARFGLTQATSERIMMRCP